MGMLSVPNSETETVFQPFSSDLKSGHGAAIRYVIAAAVLFSLLSNRHTFAAEMWADPNLQVRDGLELWLDATHATGDQTSPANGKLKEWQDASGKKRSLLSPDESARPSLLKIGSTGIVRFDGIDDQLRAVKVSVGLDSFTIVIVAAPRQNLGSFSAFMSLNAPNERDYSS